MQVSAIPQKAIAQSKRVRLILLPVMLADSETVHLNKSCGFLVAYRIREDLASSLSGPKRPSEGVLP
jgi:hypothetical protein